MIGAVVGDYFGGSIEALGVQIMSAVSVAQYETAWAAILVASLMGIAFYAVGCARGAIRAAVGSIDERADSNESEGRAHEETSRRYGVSGRARTCSPRAVGALAALTADGMASAGVRAKALTKVTLQSKWVVQSQFAGYYAAAGEGVLQAGGPGR